MDDSESDSERSVRAVTVGAAAIVALLLVSGAVVAGVGPLGGADGPAKLLPGSSADGGPSEERADGPANDADGDQQFAFIVESIDRCGTTCRDVTASLTNEGENVRRNVTVTTELYAGSDRVWQGEQQLGRLEPGETKTRTKRVDVGYIGAAKIQANGGDVTFVTTVDWNNGSATYQDTETVI